jgi:enoyl-CoA hydratase/carnithine racemase
LVAEAGEDILLSIDDDGVAVVTLNRPAKRNAVTFAMWRRLEDLFRDLGGRADVRAVILVGAGGHFFAGADISEFATLRSNSQTGRAYEAATEAATVAIRDCPRPTIAAVRGYGMGGGCGLALACDMRVGDATTRMGIPAARLGIVYGTLDCGLLLRQVGLANAKRVLYSGRDFGIEDCLSMGLIDQRAEADALSDARALAVDLAGNAPLSIAGSKLVLEALAEGETQARAGEINAIIDRAMESADYREGARAFLEKRRPEFKGA